MRGRREQEGGRRGASGRVDCVASRRRVDASAVIWMTRRMKTTATTALLLLPLCSFLFPLSPHAQTRRVEILNADLVEVTTDSAGTVRRLSGNVRLRQDTTALRADRAVYSEARGEVVLTGSVRIVSGRDTLTAARVVYDSNTKTAVADGAVRVGSGEATLFAPQTTYDSRAEVSTFTGGGRLLHRGAVLTAPTGTYSSASRLARASGSVRLVDSTGVLTASRGLYDTRIQRADFGGDVRLVRPDARLEADSVVYFRRTERARAYGRVALERLGAERTATATGDAPADSTRRTFLFGESLLYDGDAETARVRGTPDGADARPGTTWREPLFVVLRADRDGRAADTTLARAPRLDAARAVAGADTLQVLTAAGGARLWQRRLATVADSLHFARTPAATGRPPRDHLRLRGVARPRVWADGSQLTGDSLDASAVAEALDSLLVVGAAFAARVDSTVGRLQQIAGGRMLARFRDDSLRTLSVWPNAEALAFRATPDGRLAGAEQLSADSLAFRFVGGEIREVAGVGGVEGTSFGPTVVPAGVRLPGYAYDPADAPRPDALLDGWEAAWLRDWLAAHPDWAGPDPPEASPPEGEEAEPAADAGSFTP